MPSESGHRNSGESTGPQKRDISALASTLWTHRVRPLISQYRGPIIGIVLIGSYLSLGTPLQDLGRLRRVIFASWEFVAIHPILRDNPGIAGILAVLVGIHLYDVGEGDMARGAFLAFTNEVIPATKSLASGFRKAAGVGINAIGKGLQTMWVNRGRLIDMSVIELFPTISLSKIVMVILASVSGLSLGYVLGFIEAIPYIG